MRLRTRIRLLELYVIVSLLILVVLVLGGFARSPQRFGEIDVERLNIVD